MQAVKELNQLYNFYHENKIAHAYLIETNNMEECLKDLKEVVKQINCPSNYKKNCKECNICNLMENNYLPSFILVEADGKNIKKEQVLDLKSRFSSIPTFTKENIYIIKEAEKLNASSANTMLKFIEEPEDHIIGFFLTNNINNVITTIKSRCEVLKIKYDTNAAESLMESPYFDTIYQYLNSIENNKDSIMNNRNNLLNIYSERTDIQNIFQLILEIFKRCINEKASPKNDGFTEKFSFLIQKNMHDLVKKEKITIKYIEEINYNVNIELFLDKYVIELSGLNE